jgi:hypothetical protein
VLAAAQEDGRPRATCTGTTTVAGPVSCSDSNTRPFTGFGSRHLRRTVQLHCALAMARRQACRCLPAASSATVVRLQHRVLAAAGRSARIAGSTSAIFCGWWGTWPALGLYLGHQHHIVRAVQTAQAEKLSES